ncbi:MAG: extracellular solute-binding protein [Bilifractor sp.]
MKKIFLLLLTGVLAGTMHFPTVVYAEQSSGSAPASGSTASTSSGEDSNDVITLRVCNWEEYMDTGDWSEDETIDLDSGDIIGRNSMIQDFEDWYAKTYGKKVKVEYSTFGTNEDLYNMLTLGDVYDLICPSEYMIMKLMSEGQLLPLSDHFYDTSDENNYYAKGISPYINQIFTTKEINGETWSKYAAGYMWGITGIVYNPAYISEEEASTWTIFDNPKFKRQLTIKDNVRDSYFMAIGALKSEELTSPDFTGDPDYHQNLEDVMNDTSPQTIAAVQDYLQDVKDNVYSFETDAGKSDMITGKVLANYQWSGDAVYTMDQADEDNYTLNFAVPKECTNIYFDGWVMLKKGIGEDKEKQQAAEAFINFLSRPDNVIRNMYYIGYTSVISGGNDPRIFEYLKWNYGADPDDKDTVPYDVSYFFSGDESGKYVLTVPKEQTKRQLSAQYPSQDAISRSSIMVYFNPEKNSVINQMWVNVRCFNIRKTPVWGWILIAAAAAGIVWLCIFRIRRKASEMQ